MNETWPERSEPTARSLTGRTTLCRDMTHPGAVTGSAARSRKFSPADRSELQGFMFNFLRLMAV